MQTTAKRATSYTKDLEEITILRSLFLRNPDLCTKTSKNKAHSGFERNN